MLWLSLWFGAFSVGAVQKLDVELALGLGLALVLEVALLYFGALALLYFGAQASLYCYLGPLEVPYLLAA